MHPLLTTSFDRRARYSYIEDLRQRCFSPSPISILDVGDPYGTLAPVFPADRTVSLDLFSESPALGEGHAHVIGSGFALPFPDSSFDMTASHDVFEHLPDEHRPTFVRELLRVSRGPVVLVAPFADPRSARCEFIVNSYYVARTGRTLEPLDEHAEGGLPDLDRLRTFLDGEGIEHLVHRGGWLYHWLGFMLLKAHFVAERRVDLDRAVDTAFNSLLRERDLRAPHYRAALVLRPPDGAPRPESSRDDDADTITADLHDLTELGWELVGRLSGGANPADPASSVADWIAQQLEADEPRRELASSLRTALTDAWNGLQAVEAPAPAPVTPSMVVVVDGWGREDQARAAVAELAQQASTVGPATVRFIVSAEQAGFDDSGVELVVDPEPDWLLRLNRAASVDVDCLVYVDPMVDFGDDLLRGLLDAYQPTEGVRGVAVTIDGLPTLAPAAGFQPDGDEVLYARRQLMLIDRTLYHQLGGFDGMLEGVLDDVDLGWRVTLLGGRIRTAATRARWLGPREQPDAAALERAALRLLVKNLGDRTLAPVLSAELLARQTDGASGRSSAGPQDLLAGLDGMAEVREQVQSSRRVSDAALVGRFGMLAPAGGGLDAGQQQHVERLLGLARGSKAAPTSIAVTDDGSPRMRRIADALAGMAEVVLVSPERLRSVDAGTDVVVTAGGVLAAHPDVADVDSFLVVDVALSSAVPDDVVAGLVGARADCVVCETEAQADLWRGQLAAVRRLAFGRAHLPTDEAVVVVPEPVERSAATVPADASLRTDAPLVVVDLADVDAADDVAAAVVLDGLLLGAEMSGARVTICHPGGELPPSVRVVVAAAPDGQAPVLASAPDSASRRRLFAAADVVVRPGGDAPRARLASATHALDAIATRTPLVVRAADPLAAAVARDRAGVVVWGGPEEAVAAVHRLVASAPARAAASAGADVVAARRSWPALAQPLLETVGEWERTGWYRPWPPAKQRDVETAATPAVEPATDDAPAAPPAAAGSEGDGGDGLLPLARRAVRRALRRLAG